MTSDDAARRGGSEAAAAARPRPRLTPPADGPAARDGAPPEVTVVVVNFNGRHYLGECLASLEAQTLPRRSWEAILVDNGSTDGSADYVRSAFPWMRLLQASRNLGFARANNAAFRQARGRFLALLNNDTAADAGWLEGLLEALEAEPGAGGAASKIVFRDRPDLINSAGLNLYADGRGGDRGFRQPDDGRFDQPAEVFGACAAGVLLRRELLEDVGDFDERFFVYYEDLDLAWRARLRGWRFVYAPRSLVRHVHCGTSGEWSPFFVYHVERNRALVALKNAPALVAARSLAVFWARAARKWARVLALQDRQPADRGQALAYAAAGASLLALTPEMLWKRFVIRVWRRRVADGALAPLISPPPAPARDAA